MRTVLDVDEKLLTLAEQQARRDGRSLGALVEDALRAVLQLPPPAPGPSEDQADPVEAVEADDAFFDALQEIRALGRNDVARRQVSLQ